MKLSFRWYGDSDPVTLQNIRQIPGMYSVVSAVYDVKPGEVWPMEAILALKQKCEDNGLKFDVVESVPVPEEIKYGGPDAPRLIENYCENIRRLGKAGVRCICYNFMPVFDWLRSELEKKHPDGANSLAFNWEDLKTMDPRKGSFSLPGWDESYTKDQMDDLLAKYKDIDEERLWVNLSVFLKAVIPVAEASHIHMAIHPDDPPWSIFGLPRIITTEKNLDRFLKIVDSPANGLTFCTGSLGADPDNDLVKMAGKYADRIHFLHLRNLCVPEKGVFYEVGHPSVCGTFDMAAIVRALVEKGWDGYVRPDHGRMIWGEQGRYGYGLFDRALGATYIEGLFEATEKAWGRK